MVRKTGVGRFRVAAATASVLLASTALAGCGAASGDSSSGKPFFEGKTITIVVPSAAGGGTDGTARAIAQFWGKNIPGHPTVIVKDVDGGGGSTGLRQVAQTDPANGLYVAIMNIAAPLRYLFKASGYDFDLGSMEYVGALRNSPVVVMRSAKGKDVDSLQASAAKSPVVVANSDAGGSGPLQGNLGLHVLNIPDKMVFGYEGTGPISLAIKRGDVDATSVGYSAWPQTFEPVGASYPLYQVGYPGPDGTSTVRETSGDEANIPTVDELYKQKYGSAPSGQYWDAYMKIADLDNLGFSFLTRSGTPKAALTALQDGLAAMAKDTADRPTLDKQLGQAYEITSADDAEKLLQNILSTPADVVQLLKTQSGLK